jgi:hypothetical protein
MRLLLLFFFDGWTVQYRYSSAVSKDERKKNLCWVKKSPERVWVLPIGRKRNGRETRTKTNVFPNQD